VEVAPVPSSAARLVALPPYSGSPGSVDLDRERLVIGRDRGSDLALAGHGVSGRHAEVLRAGGRWLVRDLGSTRGTSLSGRPVTGPVALHDGDVLVLGDVRLLVQGLAGAGPDSAALGSPIPRQPGTAAGDVVARARRRPVGEPPLLPVPRRPISP
jgi:pSer/pThr/pTyr-binding forkhead associated (FHA) protein